MALRRDIGKFGQGARSLVRNASYLGGAALLTQLVRAVYVLALARLLGAQLYGLLAYSQSWYMTFMPLALFGLGSIIGRDLGRDRRRALPRLDSALTFRLLSVMFAAVSCVLIGLWSAPEPAHRPILFAFSFALVGRGIALWSHHVFVGAEQSRLALRQDGLFRPLEVIVGLGLVYFDGRVLSLAVWHAVVWWLQAAQGVRLVRNRLFPVVPRWEPRRLRALAGAGAPIALANILSGWLVTGPLILYTRQESVTADLVGQLALPMQLCAVLSGLMLSASIAAVPVLSRSIARGDGKELHFLWGVMGGALLIGGTVSLLGAFGGPWVVRLAFGDGFGVAGGLLGAALALLIPLTVGNAAVQVLIARGLMLKLIGSAALGAAALSASLPWLVGRDGPAGAIVAAGIGAALWAATGLAFAHLAGRAARATRGSAT